jgi:hypothetical protein
VRQNIEGLHEVQRIDLATYTHVTYLSLPVHLFVVRNNTGTANCDVRSYEIAGCRMLHGGQR